MKINNSSRVRSIVLLAMIAIVAVFVWDSHTNTHARKKEEPLVIAYGDDIAGLVLQKALQDLPAERADIGLDAINMGDCCGSNAQFALSTGEVDVAVLCPDALIDLEETGKQYTVLGELVYDGNVLVRRPDSPSELSVIGYMNGRDEQRQLLEEVFGTDKDLQPMFASALPYALENKAVDAIMLDAALALKLNYPTESISDEVVTSIMIVQDELMSDVRLQELIAGYNETVQSLADEDVLLEMLCEYLETENKEEVAEVWKTVTVRFGSLQTGTKRKP